MNHRCFIGVSLIGAVIIAAPQARSQIADQLPPPQAVAAAGAAHTTDGTHLVRATIGQAVIGNARVENTDAALGFWHPLPRTTSGAPAAGTESPTLQVSPNPFNGATHVALRNPQQQHVSLVLFNLIGQPVRTFLDDVRTKGTHTIDITAHDLPSGRYTLVLSAGDEQRTISLLLVN